MTTTPVPLGAVARSAVCAARRATVIWSDPDGGPERIAAVGVSTDEQGCLLVRLEPGSPVAQGISAHPVITVVVPAADPWTAVALDGVAHRVPHPSSGLFRLAPSGLIVRGAHDHDVPVAAYFAAAGRWSAAPAVVAHLAAGHTDELAAYLRGHGVPTAESGVPVALDASGLSLVALTRAGTTPLTIRFPVPATSLEGALQTLRHLLACDGGHGPRPA